MNLMTEVALAETCVVTLTGLGSSPTGYHARSAAATPETSSALSVAGLGFGRQLVEKVRRLVSHGVVYYPLYSIVRGKTDK
jgi:hypothetical protein